MSIRGEVQKRIQRKRNELFGLYDHQESIQTQITATEQVIAELESLLKLVPHEEGNDTQSEINLRPNSVVAKARDALRKLRKATHIDELLRVMELPLDKKRSLTGQLSLYSRKGQVFTRPQPNTFGLLEWADTSVKKRSDGSIVVGNPQSDTFAIIVPSPGNEDSNNTNGHKVKEPELTDNEIEALPTALSLDD